MIKNKTINEKISALEHKYKNDAAALEEIERAKETILYYEKQGDEKKAQSEVNQLVAFLHDWH